MVFIKSIFFFIIFGFAAVGADFQDKKFNLNLTYSGEDWEILPNPTFRDRLLLKHSLYPVTLNVIAYNFDETITVNGLVQKRIQTTYDGWQVIKQKEISDIKKKEANVDEGMLSMYRKPSLDESLNKVFQMAVDYCLVVNDTYGVIINTSAKDTNSFLEVGQDVKEINQSFWYGEKRPQLNYLEPNNSEWIMRDQSFNRQRYLNAKFRLNDSVKKESSVNIDEFDLNKMKVVHNKNGTYFWDKNRVLFLNQADEVQGILKVDFAGPDIILADDGFFLLNSTSPALIRKYNNDLKLQWERKIDEQVLDVGLLKNKLLIISELSITLLDKDQSEIWSFNHDISIGETLVVQNLLVISDTKTNNLYIVNLNHGEIMSQMNHKNKLFDNEEDSKPYQLIDMGAKNDGNLILIYKIDNQYVSIMHDINSFKDEFKHTLVYDDLSLKAITPTLIIFEVKEKNIDGIETHSLTGLDINTFAPAWTIDMSYYANPLITSNEVLLLDHNFQLQSFDISTGKQGVFINLDTIVNEKITSMNEEERIISVEKVFTNGVGILGLFKSRKNQVLDILR